MSSSSTSLPLLWHKSETSASGQPKLLPDEIALRSYDGVLVFHQEAKKIKSELFALGSCTLTSCRIIYSDKSKGDAVYHILLSNVLAVEDCKTFLSFSKRVDILFSTANHTLISGISSSSNQISNNISNNSSPEKINFGIKFENYADKDNFIAVTSEQLKRKPWVQIISRVKLVLLTTSTGGGAAGSISNGSSSNEVSTEPVVSAFSTQKAGISGIVKRQEKEIEEVDSLSKQAMGDLEGLMSNAHEVVKVIEKYSKYLESRAAEKEAAGLEADTDSMYGEKNTMEEILQSIGVVSPVTRLSAGRLYQRQLSGQIADLLIDKFILQKVGGVITLSDLYCLVNRARGTELLSPADFLSACELFNSLNLGIKYKCFPSGVKVVLSSDASNESMQARMLHIIEDRFNSAHQGVFAGDVAHDLNISIVIAVELLYEVESKGLICRDDSIDGLCFYINRF